MIATVGCSGDDSNGGGGADSGTADTSVAMDTGGGSDSSPGHDAGTTPDSSSNLDSSADADSSGDAGYSASWLVAPTVPALIQACLRTEAPSFSTALAPERRTTPAVARATAGRAAGRWSPRGAALSDCNGNVFAVLGPHGPDAPAVARERRKLRGGREGPTPGLRPTAATPSVNWLLLQAASYGGDAGVMDNVLYVQRLDTDGGEVPSTMACDEAGVGTAATRVHRRLHARR